MLLSQTPDPKYPKCLYYAFVPLPRTVLVSLRVPPQLLGDLIGLLLDWQYSSYLVHGLPQDYLDEFQGAEDASAAFRIPLAGTYIKRAVVRG